MKYAYAIVGMVLLGITGLVFLLMFESITIDNESEYYTLKDVTKSAMYESFDRAYYSQYGEIKIVERIFVNNFIRRFSKTVSGDVDNYNIEFYDLIEMPPKVSVKITSGSKNYTYLLGESNDLDITNGLTAILETKD